MQVLRWVWGAARTNGKRTAGKKASKRAAGRKISAPAKREEAVIAPETDAAASKPAKNLGKCMRDGLRKNFPAIVDCVLNRAKTDLAAARMVFGLEQVKDEIRPKRKGRTCGPSLASILQAELAKTEQATSGDTADAAETLEVEGVADEVGVGR